MRTYGKEKQSIPCCPGHSPDHKWGVTRGRLPACAKAALREIKRQARAAGAREIRVQMEDLYAEEKDND